MIGTNTSELPPGFRFHPTDEELIMFYLRNQATSKPCPVSIIPEVDIYKFNPWELPEKTEFREKELYFFTPRDRKYPNGLRPNRTAVSGYWKATGTDKSIYSASKHVGVKKALVFYKGKPPKGIKTDWIMHEYLLSESKCTPNKQNGSMRLDDWVLCRIYKKKNMARVVDIKAEESSDHFVASNNDAIGAIELFEAMKLPRTCSLTHLWEFDYITSMASVSQLFNDDPCSNSNATFDDQETTSQGNVSSQYSDDAMKFQVNNDYQENLSSHLNLYEPYV